MFRLVLPFLGLSEFCISQDISNVEDVKVLSELPMERLLSLKRGFVVDKEYVANNTNDGDIEHRSIPQALALQGKSKLINRGDHGGGGSHYYYEEHYEKDTKKNKIQSIFQLSVTSLAFLAFGGYLLCLLIHAIKGKQNYTANPATLQAFATYVATKIQKIKNSKRPRKRRKNLKLQKRPNVNLQGQRRPNRNVRKPNKNVQKKPNGNRNSFIYGEIPKPMRPRSKRELYESAGFLVTSDNLYNALVDLSEAYTKYNTLDYLHYNHTIFRKGSIKDS